MTQLFKIIDRSVSFVLKMFSVNFGAAINFLLLKNVARVRSSRKLLERKKKHDVTARARNLKVFTEEPTRAGVAKFYIVIPGY